MTCFMHSRLSGHQILWKPAYHG